MRKIHLKNKVSNTILLIKDLVQYFRIQCIQLMLLIPNLIIVKQDKYLRRLSSEIKIKGITDIYFVLL